MKLNTSIFFILINTFIFSQIGGNKTYQFLDYTKSARIEGVGGYLISVKDRDPSLGVENPALLNRDMHGYLIMDYTNHFAGSNFGFSSYTKHYANIGTFNASILYANYGKFKYANSEGLLTGGTFTASDANIRLGYGRPLSDKLSIGINFNFLSSFYEKYNSFGLSTTLGGVYYNKEKGFSSGIIIKNIGYQIKSYRKDNKEGLPFNMVLSVSKKLKHAPIRITITYHNINKFNLLYFDENAPLEKDVLTGELKENTPPSFGKKLIQHFILGGELILSKNFHIQLGYNHYVRTMNKVLFKTGSSGLSWGISFKVKRFHISYGMGKKHIAGASNHITISTNIGKELTAEDTFYRQHKE